jgi:hypothetical protein
VIELLIADIFGILCAEKSWDKLDATVRVLPADLISTLMRRECLLSHNLSRAANNFNNLTRLASAIFAYNQAVLNRL